jgi:hypothetical protein
MLLTNNRASYRFPGASCGADTPFGSDSYGNQRQARNISMYVIEGIMQALQQAVETESLLVCFCDQCSVTNKVE